MKLKEWFLKTQPSFDIGIFITIIISIIGFYMKDKKDKKESENQRKRYEKESEERFKAIEKQIIMQKEVEKEMFVRVKRINSYTNILENINDLVVIIYDIEKNFKNVVIEQKGNNVEENIKKASIKLQDNLVKIRTLNQKIIEESAIYLPLNKDENEYNIFFLFNDNRNNIFYCNQEINCTKSKFGEKTDIEFINNLVDYRASLYRYKAMLTALNACNIKEFTEIDVIDISEIKEKFNQEMNNIKQIQDKEKINND